MHLLVVKAGADGTTEEDEVCSPASCNPNGTPWPLSSNFARRNNNKYLARRW